MQPINMPMLEEILQDHDALTAIRRDIHAHPELAFEEKRTSQFIANELERLGIEIHLGIGSTGVVGVVHGRDHGACGRSLGLRADMDALPMQELNTFAHASVHPCTMHGCGHDGHTTMLLGAARYLANHRDFDGTVYLIFQPAEEGEHKDHGMRSGGREMVKDGLFERFPMEAVFGIHNWPGAPVGTLAIAPGPVLASVNEFDITITGKGTHAASPHLGLDPIPVACQIVQAFQTIISRNMNPIDTAIITVGQINAGTTTNVIPEQALMAGTVRTFTLEVLDLIEARMREVTERIAAAYNMTATFHFYRALPPTINHEAEAEFVRQVAVDVLGEPNVIKQEPVMGGEDFSLMLLERPGAFMFLGNGETGDHRATGHGTGPCTLHNGSYDFNDELLPIGSNFWVHLAMRWLART